MKKPLTILSMLLISLAFVVPMQASAATSAGIKPGSFFYFFDTTFENISLFFTFNPKKKTQKALEYADERLAEIEAVAEEKNPDAVKTAIANYESNLALAMEKSKEVKDKEQAETLLNSIADNNSRNQEVLAAVLVKVPEEAKAAITRAIEASRKGQEEATKQIAELKKEVSELKQELENLKGELKDKEEKPEVDGEKKIEQTKAIDKLKNEIESLKKKVSEPSQKETKTENKKEELKNSIVNLPSGAVVEMDASGNIIRTIKEAPQQTYTAPAYIPPSNSTNSSSNSTQKIKITLGAQTVDKTVAQIEWTTSEPTESKLYLSGGGLNSKLFASETGYSTNHLSTISQLTPITDYSFQITAIGNAGFADVFGGFKTKTPPPTIKFDQSSHGISMGAQDKISWKSSYVESCTASGAWSGIKSTNGEELVSFNQAGTFIYDLACTGLSGGTANATLTMTVSDSRPKITFYFNDTQSNTFFGKVGETVKLRWETSNTSGTNSCTASNSWSGSKYIGGSQNILLETAGEFSYTLTCINGGSGESGINTATITVIQ